MDEMRASRITLLSCFIIFYWVIMIIDFFLTANPYMAYAGNSNYGDNRIVSTTFFINPVLILMVSLVVMAFVRKIFFISYYGFFVVMLSLLTGIFNGGVFHKIETYMINAIIVTLVFSFGGNLIRYEDDDNIVTYRKFVTLISVLIMCGYVLALFRPGVYGVVLWKFERGVIRGSITLWSVLGISILLPAYSLIILEYDNKWRYMLVCSFMILFNLASFNRANVIELILPFFAFILIRYRTNYKIILMMFLFGVAICFSSSLLLMLKNVFLLNERFSLYSIDKILNGRYQLWEYCVRTFLDNFWFGKGAGYLLLDHNYVGAKAEVGFVQWFAESGVFFGTSMLFLIVRAFGKAYRILKTENNNKMDLLFAYIVFSSFYSIFQSYYRILNLRDAIFWIAVIYMNKDIVRRGIYIKLRR